MVTGGVAKENLVGGTETLAVVQKTYSPRPLF